MGTKKKLKEKKDAKLSDELAYLEHLDWVSDNKPKKMPTSESEKLRNKKNK